MTTRRKCGTESCGWMMGMAYLEDRGCMMRTEFIGWENKYTFVNDSRVCYHYPDILPLKPHSTAKERIEVETWELWRNLFKFNMSTTRSTTMHVRLEFEFQLFCNLWGMMQGLWDDAPRPMPTCRTQRLGFDDWMSKELGLHFHLGIFFS